MVSLHDQRPPWLSRLQGRRTRLPWCSRIASGAQGGVRAVLAAGALAAWTDRGEGLKYTSNQDGYLAAAREDGSVLLAICDGVGGHAAGAEASAAILAHLERAYFTGGSDLIAWLNAAPQALANHVAGLDHIEPELRIEASTTVVCALIEPDRRMTIAHAGDSRLILLRNGTVLHATLDHTVAGDLLRAGLIEPVQLAGHPDRNLMTRSVRLELDGTPEALVPEVTLVDLLPGDRIVLASDGYELFAEHELIEMVAGARDPGRALSRMRSALRSWVKACPKPDRADDNATLILLFVG